MRTELALLSQEWSLSVDPEGHYIDIFGRPQMPTTTELAAGDELKRCYEEVNVATIYLEQPNNELRNYAKFQVMAPRRIEYFLNLLDQYQATFGTLPK